MVLAGTNMLALIGAQLQQQVLKDKWPLKLYHHCPIQLIIMPPEILVMINKIAANTVKSLLAVTCLSQPSVSCGHSLSDPLQHIPYKNNLS
jgi:hypothetical protein